MTPETSSCCTALGASSAGQGYKEREREGVIPLHHSPGERKRESESELSHTRPSVSLLEFSFCGVQLRTVMGTTRRF